MSRSPLTNEELPSLWTATPRWTDNILFGRSSLWLQKVKSKTPLWNELQVVFPARTEKLNSSKAPCFHGQWPMVRPSAYREMIRWLFFPGLVAGRSIYWLSNFKPTCILGVTSLVPFILLGSVCSHFFKKNVLICAHEICYSVIFFSYVFAWYLHQDTSGAPFFFSNQLSLSLDILYCYVFSFTDFFSSVYLLLSSLRYFSC